MLFALKNLQFGKVRFVFSKTFCAGLLLRLVMVFFFTSVSQEKYFLPFLRVFFDHPTFNPWGYFSSLSSVDLAAFPYGAMMLFPILAVGLVIHGMAALFPLVHWERLVLPVSILSFDFATYVLLSNMVNRQHRRAISTYYWLSPIVFSICYLQGQLDIIPVFFLGLSLFLLENKSPFWAGGVLASAVSAKLSMVIGVPVLLIYLWRNKRVHHFFRPFIIGLLVVSMLTMGPFVFSEGYAQMVLLNPQIYKATLLSLSFSGHDAVYVLPVVILCLLYYVWVMERLTQQLLYIYMAIFFIIVILLTPASLGWYLWMVPFLLLYLVNAGRKTDLVLYWVLSMFYLLYCLYILNVLPSLNWISISFSNNSVHAIFVTVIDALLIVFAVQMYRKGVQGNSYYCLSRVPLSIGIAGDSGSGKDTLSAALLELFPKESAASISGDDYHRWDRYNPLWQSITHLNPNANDLYKFASDIFALMAGRSIYSRHYDHQTGRFTRCFSTGKKDIVIASGLHTFHVKKLNDILSVKVFLDMNEALRRYLKVERDVNHRGHSLEKVLDSLSFREHDREVYIQPQREKADLIFSLKNLVELNLEQAVDYVNRSIPMCLEAILVNADYSDDLVRFLSINCGVYVEQEILHGNAVRLYFYEPVSAQDIELGVKNKLPDILESLSLTPKWEEGFLGIMQLITLFQLHENVLLRGMRK